MATNPKDKSLSTRKETIGRKAWPNLPPQLLNFIAWQPNLMDNISYPGTTKSWRTKSSRCNKNGKSKWPQLFDSSVVNWCDSRKTLSPFVNIYFRGHLGCYWSPHALRIHPVLVDYVGYSCGVLVGQEIDQSKYVIYDAPSTGSSWLPPWDVNIPFRFIVFSSSPIKNSWKNAKVSIILVITGNCNPAFAICRSGREEKYVWVRHDSMIIDPHDSENQLMKFTSGIAFEDRFYVLSLQGTLAVLEDINSQLVITAISKTRAVPSIKARRFRECLLESNGEILLIFLVYQNSTTRVDQVEVFKLHLPNLVWVKMVNLGDRTLFLEPECCIWVTASNVGCRSNCVYFNQGEIDGWLIYDLKRNSISPMGLDSIKWFTPHDLTTN